MSTAVRIRFSKVGKIRFTSHRDLARVWERALRRADLPLAYTEGFSPRPKLSFGLALSTGHESLGEYLDVVLRDTADPVAVERLPALLAPVLPAGIDVQAVFPLAPGAESLQQAVTSCTWYIEVADVVPPDVAVAVSRALGAADLPLTRERKGRTVTDDVRPAVLDVRILGPVTEVVAPLAPRATGIATALEAELATQPRGLRPAELIAAIDPTWTVARVTRIHQWTQAGGARREVVDLSPAATPPPHAEARAS
ncbi:MAG TPA: TIGR03936 family radical SAM-associated protein [Acidimicrobiales bacterium]|nr:TIGR03936 family radical SAM-associated protein [Acidimicrobiales bacterium]